MRRRTLLQGLASTAGLSLAGPGAWAQKASPGRWLRLESTNFVAVSAADETQTRAELAALEGFHTLLTRLMPRKDYSLQKLQVHMTGADRDFKATAPWAESGVLGFYETSVEQVRAVSTLNKSIERQSDMVKGVRALDARAVLFHEYAHHYTAANTRVIYPSWYNEGIAEFLSTADFVEDGVLVGKFTANRAIWLMNSAWVPIETFLTKNPRELSSDREAAFYAQAWLVAHYFFRHSERAAGFDKYVEALQSGGDPMSAFEPSFGISPAAFDKELRTYRKQPMSFVKVPGVMADPTIEMKAERLPVSANELFMPMTYLRAVPKPRLAEQSVAAIRGLAAKYENDAFALRSLALAEIWYGDLEKARKLIEALLKIDIDSADTQHLRGLCDLRRAYAADDVSLFAAARTGFATAYKIDDTRANSLFRYAECCIRETPDIDENTLNALIRTYRIAPQVDEYIFAAAQALMRQKRFPEAVAVLRPAVADLHDTDVRKAQDLMVLAKAEIAPKEFFLFGSADRVKPDAG